MPNKLSPHGKTIVEGSVSWGTLRTQDLLRRFASELEEIKPFGEHGLLNEARTCADDLEAGRPCADAQEVLSEVMDVLNSAAPDGMYFGATEGDGSDYGFWSTNDEEDA